MSPVVKKFQLLRRETRALDALLLGAVEPSMLYYSRVQGPQPECSQIGCIIEPNPAAALHLSSHSRRVSPGSVAIFRVKADAAVAGLTDEAPPGWSSALSSAARVRCVLRGRGQQLEYACFPTDYGFDVQVTVPDGCPAHCYVELCSIQVAGTEVDAAKALIPVGYNHDNRSIGRVTAAALIGDVDALRLALDTGASTEEWNWRDMETPLHVASAAGHAACAAILIEAGAKINAGNKAGRTPLHLAARAGHRACVCALLSIGAEVDIKDSCGATALHLAASYVESRKQRNALECLHELVLAGANLDAADMCNQTPLHCASSSGQALCVKALVAAGANIEATDELAKTPLHLAAENGMTDSLWVLITAGADLEALDQYGKTPLILSALEWHDGCVRRLIDAGAIMPVDSSHKVRNAVLTKLVSVAGGSPSLAG